MQYHDWRYSDGGDLKMAPNHLHDWKPAAMSPPLARIDPRLLVGVTSLEGLVEPHALSRKEDPTTKPACSVVVRGPVWWTQRRSSRCCAMQEYSSWMRARVRHQMGRRVVHEVLRIPPSTCEGVSAGLDSQRTCP